MMKTTVMTEIIVLVMQMVRMQVTVQMYVVYQLGYCGTVKERGYGDMLRRSKTNESFLLVYITIGLPVDWFG